MTDQTIHELVVVYIGRAGCYWCKRPELKDAVHRMRPILAASANQHGYRFYQQAIGLDAESARPDGNLEALGAFDEVSVGGGWANTAVRRFLLGDFAGPAATPQLIVYSRSVAVPGPTNGEIPMIRDERLVTRKVGLAEIVAWVDRGAPLPGLQSATNRSSTSDTLNGASGAALK
jgi:hypothetical protein